MDDDSTALNRMKIQISQTRNELNNIRRCLNSFKCQHRKDIQELKKLLNASKNLQGKTDVKQISPICEKNNVIQKEDIYKTKPIGFLRSCHRHKNATPRQGSITSLSRGTLTVSKDIFNNPSHSLEGLEHYSHVWILFIFDQSICRDDPKAKVSPPRLDGGKIGVYASRSPHRPNSIGLTLATLDSIEGDTIMLSGIDILDNTAVLDIKPYIPQYDSPSKSKHEPTADTENSLSSKESITSLVDKHKLFPNAPGKNVDIHKQESSIYDQQNITITETSLDCEETLSSSKYKDLDIELREDEDDFEASSDGSVKTASWVSQPPAGSLTVIFNPIAEVALKKFSKDAADVKYKLEYLSCDELKKAIVTVLSEDPRSSYRRKKCIDRLYYCVVDSAHLTAFFDESTVEVLRISPVASKQHLVQQLC